MRKLHLQIRGRLLGQVLSLQQVVISPTLLNYFPSNACAAEEYSELVKVAPPYDLGSGVIYEAVFSGANKRNVIISFTGDKRFRCGLT